MPYKGDKFTRNNWNKKEQKTKKQKSKRILELCGCGSGLPFYCRDIK
ncbi:MAG: hypothetical protein ACTSR8_20990 [Promethearchaeota archaeon]